MSDSDMDIDDDDVQPQDTHTISAVSSDLVPTPIQASGSHNDVKKHLTTPISRLNDLGFLQPYISGNIGMISKVEDGKGPTFSRFPLPGHGMTAKSFPLWKEPEPKRVAHPCKFFARGWCANGNSCRFLHVKENSNHTGQQLAQSNMAGTSNIQSVEGKRTLDNKNGVRVPLLSENGMTSLPRREDVSLVNPLGSQRVFPFNNEMRFMPSSDILGAQSLVQKYGADVNKNSSLLINNSSSFPLRSSFVHDQIPSITSFRKTDIETPGLPWSGSLFSSVPVSGSALGNYEDKKNTYGSGSGSGSGSLPTLQGTSASSNQGAEEGNTTSDEKKVPSDDWEPSEPFKASFTIPPYILPSSDALYDPFTDVDNREDRSRNSQQARENNQLLKDGDSVSGPQARDCYNDDDKNSSCSQNQAVAIKNLEADRVVEGVATSVVDQNDTTTSKEVSSAAAAENKVGLKRSKPAGHDSWHRSDGSSYKKTVRADEIDGEVRSDAAGMKAMRQFRTAVVETIKEMLKPLWREGRLTKEVHNMIVKKAAEKVVSGAVQFNQVPTDTEAIDQYLSLSATKIVKLVEGYVEKYGKSKS